jgi:hypothetical protein
MGTLGPDHVSVAFQAERALPLDGHPAQPDGPVLRPELSPEP